MRYWWVNQNQTYRAEVPGSFMWGYITLSGSQELVIVPEVRDKLLDAWGIDAGVRVGEFSRAQNIYLDYHRVNVFKHALLER
jgi:hypothetical protein